jgi:adenylate cyclase
MTEPWTILIFAGKRLIGSFDLQSPLELGRQKAPGEELFTAHDSSGGRVRIALAPLEEVAISRAHAFLERRAGGVVRLHNVSTAQPIQLAQGEALQPGEAQELHLPAAFMIADLTLRLEEGVEAEAPVMQSLASVAPRPGQFVAASLTPGQVAIQPGDMVDVEAYIQWLQAAVGVLHSAASSEDFFARAARALVDLVALDSGQVLLLTAPSPLPLSPAARESGDLQRSPAAGARGKRGTAESRPSPAAGERGRGEGDAWTLQALHKAAHLSPGSDMPASRHILDQVLREKRTFWEVPPAVQGMQSLRGVMALVAAPILNGSGEVIGALYGDRWQSGLSGPLRPITKLDAMLVELLACGVAAGLARLEQEKIALSTRVQFEQFFTPELSRQLTAHPDLLQGREALVTVLFCDIRGFSRLSERLGPARTVEWLSAALGAFSETVAKRHGVLVDYTGDELMAMWGAPEEQPAHARLACQAALEIIAQLPELNARWQAVLQEPLDVGIGINTGMARVGNIGSHRKFKYGPLGNTVNLASRVQGAGKFVKSRLLITGSTRAQLDETFATRRLGKVRVVNISEPVELYELVPPGQPGWHELRDRYERALAAFEGRHFRSAASVLGPSLLEFPKDGPTILLLSRVAEALAEPPADFDGVWELPGK